MTSQLAAQQLKKIVRDSIAAVEGAKARKPRARKPMTEEAKKILRNFRAKQRRAGLSASTLQAMRAKNQAYRALHKDKIAARAKARRQANPLTSAQKQARGAAAILRYRRMHPMLIQDVNQRIVRQAAKRNASKFVPIRAFPTSYARGYARRKASLRAAVLKTNPKLKQLRLGTAMIKRYAATRSRKPDYANMTAEQYIVAQRQKAAKQRAARKIEKLVLREMPDKRQVPGVMSLLRTKSKAEERERLISMAMKNRMKRLGDKREAIINYVRKPRKAAIVANAGIEKAMAAQVAREAAEIVASLTPAAAKPKRRVGARRGKAGGKAGG